MNTRRKKGDESASPGVKPTEDELEIMRQGLARYEERRTSFVTREPC